MTVFVRSLALLAVLMLTSCASLRMPTAAQQALLAGCQERAAAMLPPSPPTSDDYREWAGAYVGAVNAYTDSENKRAATADCLDKLRAGKKRWWRIAGE